MQAYLVHLEKCMFPETKTVRVNAESPNAAAMLAVNSAGMYEWGVDLIELESGGGVEFIQPYSEEWANYCA